VLVRVVSLVSPVAEIGWFWDTPEPCHSRYTATTVTALTGRWSEMIRVVGQRGQGGPQCGGSRPRMVKVVSLDRGAASDPYAALAYIVGPFSP
jgi:hypothetical protein